MSILSVLDGVRAAGVRHQHDGLTLWSDQEEVEVVGAVVCEVDQ